MASMRKSATDYHRNGSTDKAEGKSRIPNGKAQLRVLEPETTSEPATEDAVYGRAGMDGEALAGAFEQALRNTRAFSWVGVVLGQEAPYARPLDIYLSERAEHRVDDAEGRGVAQVVNAFDDYAHFLEPEYNASLHVVKEKNMCPEQLKQTVIEQCQLRGLTLAWEATF